MLPLQGAGGKLARKTQGDAIGLMINIAFSHSKNATKLQHNINPTATPWGTKQRSVNHALQGQYIINPTATPWANEVAA